MVKYIDTNECFLFACGVFGMDNDKIEKYSALFDVSSSVSNEKKYKKPAPSDTGTVEIEIKGDGGTGGETIVFQSSERKEAPTVGTLSYAKKSARYSSPRSIQRKKGELVREYENDGRFINRVSIYEWGGDYGFYEKFLRDARQYKNVKGRPCPPVRFFSYIPQYSQMSRQQLEYYFFLREEIRSGRYPVADLSYILLYIYELLNLGDENDNENDVSIICGLWTPYRSLYPVIDKYLSEWIIDYCLIHSVRLPLGFLNFLPQVSSHSSLKEFYFDEATRCNANDRIFSDCLISSCSDYVPEKSRYLSEDPALLKKLKDLFSECISKMRARKCGIFAEDNYSEISIERDAFGGSLCSCSVKKRLSVSVMTPFRSQKIRRFTTEILRYCENMVRKASGVRSRLSADVPDEIKTLIDNSFSLRPESESYLSKYDAPDDAFSINNAIDLENVSWESTDRLVGSENGFADDDGFADEPAGAVLYGPDLSGYEEKREAADEDAGTETNDEIQLDEKLLSVMRRILTSENSSFRDSCRELGLFPDSAAAEINEYCSVMIGDIVLEDRGEGYVVIEDYIKDLEDLLLGDREDCKK